MPEKKKSSLPMKGTLILQSSANDTGEVYLYRAKKLAGSTRNWLELFAYETFGYERMASFALALDPYSKIRFPTMKITPTNRTVYKTSILKQTRISYRRKRITQRWNDPQGIGECRTPVKTSVTETNDAPLVQPEQDAYRGFRSDTTYRTRSSDSKGGEFELFDPRLHSPPRKNTYFTDLETHVFMPIACQNQLNALYTRYDLEIRGPAVRLLTTDLALLLAEERALAAQKLSKYGLGMVNDCLPGSRTFPLAYNIAELKDLPRMLRAATNLMILGRPPGLKHLKPGLSDVRNAGNLYLNWVFGWKQLYQSIVDMLETPAIVAKNVNRLIKQRGLPTTFRSTRKGTESISSIPSMVGTTMVGETSLGTGFTTRREYELRVMLNLTLDFPTLAVPVLRRKLTTDAWGILPEPADVYNLIPWSWLVDWFSGLGDYIEILDTVRGDKNLFNYGYFTYISKGVITKISRLQTTDTVGRVHTPGADSNQVTNKVQSHHSSLTYTYRKRSDISSLLGVTTLSRPATMSAGQQAIIGALLTKWAKT